MLFPQYTVMLGRFRLLLLLCLVAPQVVFTANQYGAEIEDNDFAEFEDFDDDEAAVPVRQESAKPAAESDEGEEPKQPKVIMSPEAAINEAEVADDDEATVEEDDDDEFEHLQDDEEFEGFDKESNVKGKPGGTEKSPDLKITQIPLHLRTNWDSFYLEMLMLAGLGVYLLNFLAGKAKNSRLANAWLHAHRAILEDNFAIIGDDGASQEPQNSGQLLKESENVYMLWCSGRVCCEGMLVTLRLLKRQDLVSTISRMFRPASDQIFVKVVMDEADMDTFVLCLAQKKVAIKLQKDMQDLSWFCPDKKSPDKHNIPTSFYLMSEIGEVAASIFDPKVVATLNKYESQIEYMHFSDQYSGVKQPDEAQPTKLPASSKVLMFSFNVGQQGRCTVHDMQEMRSLLLLVFHCVDKVKRMRLTREAKQKAEKSRQRVAETLLKANHAQRSEAAQQRKEDKRRAEKDRIMSEDDPDKQKRLEERNQKKEQKKKNPKVKMMKVKAM